MEAEKKICLRVLKAFCWSQVQAQDSFFWMEELRGAMMLEKLGMNFQYKASEGLYCFDESGRVPESNSIQFLGIHLNFSLADNHS